MLLTLALGSLVATVAAAPVVLGGGLAVQGLANRSRALPSDVTAVRLPQRSVLTDVTGRMLVELHGPEDRVVVPLQAIAPVMQHAIVAVEDARASTPIMGWTTGGCCGLWSITARAAAPRARRR